MVSTKIMMREDIVLQEAVVSISENYLLTIHLWNIVPTHPLLIIHNILAQPEIPQ